MKQTSVKASDVLGLVEARGYARMTGIMPRQPLLRLRDDILAILKAAECLEAPAELGSVYQVVRPLYFDQEPLFRSILRKIVSLQSLHEILHLKELNDLGSEIFGEGIFIHPIVFPRIVFPTPIEYHWTTATAHQDYPYIQGSPRFLTMWLPVDDCPLNRGPLAVIPGSHKLGILPSRLASHGGLEADYPKDGNWHVADMFVGDALIFHSHTVHAPTRNVSDRVRISIDLRFQPASEPVCTTTIPSETYLYDVALKDLYRKLSNPKLKFYWNRCALNIVERDSALSAGTDLSREGMLEIVQYGGSRAFPILLRIKEFSNDPQARDEALRILAERGIVSPLDIKIQPTEGNVSGPYETVTNWI